MDKTINRFRPASTGLIGITILLLSISLQACSQVSPGSPSKALELQVLQIIKEHPDVVLESVKTYQQKQQEEQKKASAEAVKQLVADPRLLIADSPTMGSPDQKIILVEFSDFQCPFCSRGHETLKKFMANHSQEVTLVYKHLPLGQIHPEAKPAALAAWAAARQGKFWEFHDALFEQQDKLGEAFYIQTAKRLNLNLQQFDADRKGDAAKTAIQKDLDLAEKLGISGTPYFLLNGTPLSGALPLDEFEKALTQAKQELASSGN